MSDVGDLLTARIVARFDGEPIINNLSFSVIEPAATWSLTAEALVADLDSALGLLASGGDWTDALSVQYAIEAIQVVDVSPGVSPMASAASSAVGGVADEDAMPPNDAMCVTFRSDFKGPSGRGRIYLTGWPEGAANGGFWVGEAQTQVSTIMASLIENFGEGAGAARFRWVILHRSSNGGVPGGPQAPVVPPEVKPVMGFTVHNEVRSLGRRAVGRRIHRRRATA